MGGAYWSALNSRQKCENKSRLSWNFDLLVIPHNWRRQADRDLLEPLFSGHEQTDDQQRWGGGGDADLQVEGKKPGQGFPEQEEASIRGDRVRARGGARRQEQGHTLMTSRSLWKTTPPPLEPTAESSVTRETEQTLWDKFSLTVVTSSLSSWWRCLCASEQTNFVNVVWY